MTGGDFGNISRHISRYLRHTAFESIQIKLRTYQRLPVFAHILIKS